MPLLAQGFRAFSSDPGVVAKRLSTRLVGNQPYVKLRTLELTRSSIFRAFALSSEVTSEIPTIPHQRRTQSSMTIAAHVPIK